MKKNRSIIILAFALLLIYALPADAEETIESALWEKGRLQELNPRMGDLLQLHFKGGVLHVNRALWKSEKKAKEAPQPGGARIRVLIGSRTSKLGQLFSTVFRSQQSRTSRTSFSFSNTEARNTLTSDTMQGELKHSVDNEKYDQVSMHFKELKGFKRELSLTINASTLTIQVEAGEEIFKLIQKDKLTIEYQKTNKAKIEKSASDFAALYRDEMLFCETVVFPLLKHYGLKFIAAPMDNQVKAKVLATMHEIKDEDAEASFYTLLKELDSADFEKREAASEKLSANFERYVSFVDKVLNDPDMSLEVIERLEELTEAHKKGAPGAANLSLVTGLKLTSNPRYLVKLFPEADEKQKAALIEQLKKLTGQDHGEDVEKWKAAVNP